MCKNKYKEIIVQQEQPASTGDQTRSLSSRVWPSVPRETQNYNYGSHGYKESLLGKANIEADRLPMQPTKTELKTPKTCRAKTPTGTEPLRESVGGTQGGMDQRQLLSSAPECRTGAASQALARNAADATRSTFGPMATTRASETKDDLMERRHVGYGGPPPLSARPAETGSGAFPTASAERAGDRAQLLRSAVPDVGAERAPAYASGTAPVPRYSVLDRGASQGDAHAAIASETGPTRSVWSSPPPASKSSGIESGSIPARANSSDTVRSVAGESSIVPRTVPEQQGSKDVPRAPWNTQVPIREPLTPRTSDLSKTLPAELAGPRIPPEHFAATRNSELYAGRNAGDPFATIRPDYSQMRTHQSINHNLDQQQNKQSALAFSNDIRQPFTESLKNAGTNHIGNNPYEGRLPTTDSRGIPEVHQPPTNSHLPDGRMSIDPNNRTGEKDATNTPHKPYGNEATNFTHKPDGKDTASSTHKPNDKDLTNTSTSIRTEGIDKPSGRPVAGSGRVESAGQMADGRIGTRVDFDGGRTSDYTGGSKSADRGVGGGSGGGSAGGGRTGDVAVFIPGVLPGTKNGTKQQTGSIAAGMTGKISSAAPLTPKFSESKLQGPQTAVLPTHDAKNKNTVVVAMSTGAAEPSGLMSALKIAAQRIFKADSLRAKIPGNPNLPGPRTEQIPIRDDNSGVETARSAAPAIVGDTHSPMKAGPGKFSAGRVPESDIEKTMQIESKFLVTSDTHVLTESVTLPNRSTERTGIYAEDYTLTYTNSSLEKESDKVADDTIISPAAIRQGMFPESQQTAYYYVAKQGDTVDSVARDVLKDATAGPLLFQMNTQIVAAIFVNGRTELFFKAGSVVYLPTPYQIVQYKAIAV